jgi:hypothetical protein
VTEPNTTVNTSAPGAIWLPPPPRDTSPAPMDPVAFALAQTYASLIALGAATSPRSLQMSVGSSEIGFECDRRLAYKLAGTPAASHSLDPMRALVGTGIHAALKDIFVRLDAGSGRFVVEGRTFYRSIPGQFDLYDRWNRCLVDWKSTSKGRLRQYRAEGLPRNYTVQPMMYAAGLKAGGEDPAQVAVVFLPYDGELSDVWAWVAPVDIKVADDACDRLDRLRGQQPSNVDNVPSRLCKYCDHHLPGSTDLRIGCPGNSEEGNTQ